MGCEMDEKKTEKVPRQGTKNQTTRLRPWLSGEEKRNKHMKVVGKNVSAGLGVPSVRAGR